MKVGDHVWAYYEDYIVNGVVTKVTTYNDGTGDAPYLEVHVYGSEHNPFGGLARHWTKIDPVSIGEE